MPIETHGGMTFGTKYTGYSQDEKGRVKEYGTNVDPSSKFFASKEENKKRADEQRRLKDLYSTQTQYDKGTLTGASLEKYVSNMRTFDKTMSDPYIQRLTSILGDNTSLNLQGVVQKMAGGGPADIKGMYEQSGVLGLAEEATKGYTPQEKEAVTSQKRQELAMAARAGGGVRGRLAGQSSEYGTAQAQFASGLAQAEAVGTIQAEEQARKDKAEKELADLRLGIAQAQKSEEDSYQRMLSDISMNLANTISITKG